MNKIIIDKVQGEVAKSSIDAFYRKNGSSGYARKDDLFFVAYSDINIVGCVRYCVEEGISMLRTMHVDSSCRQQGIGRLLLWEFGNYLDQNNIKNVFCLPHSHLEKFYGIINFQVVDPSVVPPFLLDRAMGYTQKGLNTLFMRRL